MKDTKTQSDTEHLIAPKELELLKALKSINKPSMSDLIKSTGMSQATVQRKIKELRESYRMTIRFYRSGRVRGGKGYYEIENWGVFDEKAFEEIVQNQSPG